MINNESAELKRSGLYYGLEKNRILFLCLDLHPDGP